MSPEIFKIVVTLGFFIGAVFLGLAVINIIATSGQGR